MPTSEEYMHGENQQKTQRGSSKYDIPEKLANGLVSHKSYFEVNITQRGKVTTRDFPHGRCPMI